MSSESTPAFADNWAYLRTELSWLDRVLMMAVARYRQDKRSVDRVAQSHADHASSHWWKGIISLDGNGAYDEHRKGAQPARTSAKVSYNQQLETRIKASQAKGIVLALPALRDRLSLTPFEKNVVLIGLAPEVNRRYARLYRYLQGQSESSISDLPSVELVLRLLCRNDNEWRVARQTLAQTSSLLHQGLLTLLQNPYDTLLTASVKLSEPFVRYLLAETPTTSDLDHLLSQPDSTPWAPSLSPFSLGSASIGSSTFEGQAIAIPDGGILETQSSPQSQGLAYPSYANHQAPQASFSPRERMADQFPSALEYVETPHTDWSQLVLPEVLMADLQHLSHRVRYQTLPTATDDDSSTDDSSINEERLPATSQSQGTIALFTGAPGTGKSLAAQAIATNLVLGLHWVDLSTIVMDDHPALLVDADSVSVVLIKSAQCWLSSAPQVFVDKDYLYQFLSRRRAQGLLTIFTVHHIESVAPHFLDQMDYVLPFPAPDAPLRHQLWEQALHRASLSLPQRKSHTAPNLDLLQSLRLSGGDIQRIAEDGAIAASARDDSITLDDIQQALRRQGKTRALRQLNQALTASKKKATQKRATQKKTTQKKATQKRTTQKKAT
jgi:hypothetical protein